MKTSVALCNLKQVRLYFAVHLTDIFTSRQVLKEKIEASKLLINQEYLDETTTPPILLNLYHDLFDKHNLSREILKGWCPKKVCSRFSVATHNQTRHISGSNMNEYWLTVKDFQFSFLTCSRYIATP